MRIDNSNLTGVGGSGHSGAVGSVGVNGRAPAVDSDDAAADSVKLSSASSLIALAKNVSSADRQSRISQLASEVSSGTYQVNPRDVSRAIVSQSS